MYTSKLITDPTEIIKNSIHNLITNFSTATNIKSFARENWLINEIANDGILKIEVESDGGECLVSINWNPRLICNIPSNPGSKKNNHLILDSDINWLLRLIAVEGCKIDDYEFTHKMMEEIRIGIQYDCGVPNGKIWKGFNISII